MRSVEAKLPLQNWVCRLLPDAGQINVVPIGTRSTVVLRTLSPPKTPTVRRPSLASQEGPDLDQDTVRKPVICAFEWCQSQYQGHTELGAAGDERLVSRQRPCPRPRSTKKVGETHHPRVHRCIRVAPSTSATRACDTACMVCTAARAWDLWIAYWPLSRCMMQLSTVTQT